MPDRGFRVLSRDPGEAIGYKGWAPAAPGEQASLLLAVDDLADRNDLAEALRSARRGVAEGGLFVVRTAAIASSDPVVLRSARRRHLFTPRTLQHALVSAGWRLVGWQQTRSRTPGWVDVVAVARPARTTQTTRQPAGSPRDDAVTTG